MSIAATAWAIEQRCPSPAAKLTLVMLSDWADEDSISYAPIVRLADAVGVTEFEQKRLLDELATAGLICFLPAVRNPASGQVQRAYQLLVSREYDPHQLMLELPRAQA